ncbi:MAG: sodium-dependent transporter [Candidatus Omnitrophica bacterium]|nr:sodium-dependent transporter [Candidatus Omnitrophota bacterium]
MAGSAVGLGNFLRFPVQAAQNGGGAFMIPYVLALLLLGIPLCLVEWTIGRYGGQHGHNTAVGAFGAMSHRRGFEYLGLLGVFGPYVIFLYYVFVCAWTLAYSFFAITGYYSGIQDEQMMRSFLAGFQGIEQNQYFHGIWVAYLFFLITFGLNLVVLYRGIEHGIEKAAKFMMPALLVLAVIFTLRVLMMGAPDPARPAWNVTNGLGYLWNPDFSRLKDSKVWLAAAGQIFFTLSAGIGALLTYATYLKKDDDIPLSSLSAGSTNEFVEVVLGGSIAIPAAFAFFGPLGIVEVAKSGSWNLGFVTMPLILNRIPWGELFGAIWFFVLFLAGVTSVFSLAQPLIAYLQNLFGWSRKRAVTVFGIVSFLLCQPCIFFLRQGFIDEMDFWGGTVCLVLFSLFQVIIFGWVFGLKQSWEEMHRGAHIKVPAIFKFIIKYVTPAYLLLILGAWVSQYHGVFVLSDVPPEKKPYAIAARVMMTLMIAALALMIPLARRLRRRVPELEPR